MATNIVTTNSKDIDTYVPFGGANVELGEDAVAPAPEYPLLQYATGLPAQRPKLDADGCEMYDEDGELQIDNLYYAGFFTPYGVSKEIDEAMIKASIPWIDIVHRGGDVVRHWMLEKPGLFLIANGIPSNGNSKGQMGMVYLWRAKKNSDRNETILYAQVIIRQLLPHYNKPFVFTVKSTQTADALGALKRQYKVLGKAREILRRAGRGDMALPLWSYSLILGASKKQDQRGTGANSKTIFPMISGIPDEPTGAYLQKHEVPLDLVERFKDLTEKSVEWAKTLSERIASGVETHEPWKSANSVPTEDNPF